MYASGELINGALHLRTFADISSYPCAFVVFRDFIIFSISLAVVRLNWILGYDCSRFLRTLSIVASF